jgi:hypothetical protein
MQSRPNIELAAAAYRRAWQRLTVRFEKSPAGRLHAPRILRDHILRLINEGKRNSEEIADIALGSLRQNQQLKQSAMRVGSAEFALADAAMSLGRWEDEGGAPNR